MKIRLVSDLHLEFMDFSPYPVAEGEFDALVNAGDTHPWGEMRKHWGICASGGRPYVEALGNHDFYRGVFPERGENQAITEVCGARIASATLWTAFDPGMWEHFAFSMADSRFIKGLTYDRMQACFHSDLQHLMFADADVWVTHHSPSRRGAVRFAGSAENPFFHNDLEEQLLAMKKPPKLWIHGHSHEPVDYMIGSTRVLSHPRGYPGEPPHHGYDFIDVVVDT